MLPRLGLRAGWRDALKCLGNHGVPTYIFSSGYGNIVAEVVGVSARNLNERHF